MPHNKVLLCHFHFLDSNLMFFKLSKFSTTGPLPGINSTFISIASKTNNISEKIIAASKSNFLIGEVLFQ